MVLPLIMLLKTTSASVISEIDDITDQIINCKSLDYFRIY